MVFYKPGKSNILADALSRRSHYDPRRDMGNQPGSAEDEDDDICLCCAEQGLNAIISTPELSIRTQVAESYANDSFYTVIISYLRHPSEGSLAKLTKPTRDNIKRVTLDGPLPLGPCLRRDRALLLIDNRHHPVEPGDGLADAVVGLAHLTSIAAKGEFASSRLPPWFAPSARAI